MQRAEFRKLIEDYMFGTFPSRTFPLTARSVGDTTHQVSGHRVVCRRTNNVQHNMPQHPPIPPKTKTKTGTAVSLERRHQREHSHTQGQITLYTAAQSQHSNGHSKFYKLYCWNE
eukprot:527026-Prorocentrum_minimum.AAC.2